MRLFAGLDSQFASLCLDQVGPDQVVQALGDQSVSGIVAMGVRQDARAAESCRG